MWYIFPRFGMLNQEKSGNPALRSGRAVHDNVELPRQLKFLANCCLCLHSFLKAFCYNLAAEVSD
jgi:hypothetical protein